MAIMLTAEQQKRLEAEVAAGRFKSVEDAVRAAVDYLLFIDAADLEWAKPMLDAARASLRRGQGVPADDVFAETNAWLKKRGG